MKVLEFIESSNRAPDIETLVTQFRGALESYGYSQYCSFSQEGHKPEQTPTEEVLAHFNAEFHEIYERRRFVDVDPIYKLFLRTAGPFTWEQVSKLPLSDRAREVMEARRRTGMRKGLAMTVQCAQRELIGMSVASNYDDSRDDPQAVTELYAIGNQYHLARARLLGKAALHLPDIRLSPREREMLKWCSQGKSNSVIGTILGISEKTVEHHLASVFRKLDVSSRTTAVLKAVNLKLIHVSMLFLACPREFPDYVLGLI